MKRLLLGSMIAATLLLTTGCDDDDTTPAAENAAPVLGAVDTTMITGASTTLTATDETPATVTFTTDSTDFTIAGSTLTAPDTAATYNVTIVTTDAAGLTDTDTVSIVVSEPSAGGIVYNSLGWDALIARDDANDTVSGRQNQTEAAARCVAAGKRLPTLAELQTSALELKTDTAFRSDAGNQLVVWSGDTDLTGYYFNGVEANVTVDDDSYTDAAWTDATTNFYTCVEAQ